ncbi:MAG TPA: hypothetical protein VIU41_00405 [Geobacteraceae bacterium]
MAGTGGDHPAAYLTNPAQCVTCHGNDLLGGIAKVSCFSASFAGIACHPNGPSNHPAGFANPTAHGPQAKAKLEGINGFAHCQTCHGTNFTGGVNIAGTLSASCVTCHGVPAPHPPKPWRASQFTHTNTDPSNAALCAQCHTAGANLTPELQQTYVTGTPGCFNSTLCHGQVGHVSGWAAPEMHGKSAKAVPSPTEGINYCRSCHGSDLHGGTGAPSCFACHTTAPHSPTPWRSATRTHTDTATGNAAVCILCHLNGEKSQTPVTVPPGTTADCFNGSMCHATVGHPAGWEQPSQHGTSAKDHPSGNAGFSSCQNCHGATFVGSFGIPSCINNAACHGATVAAPHPKLPWLNSPLTHTNTATENAAVCSACHLGGANLTVSFKTKYNPISTGTPGCFSNNLCHPNLGNCASCHSSQQGTGRRPVIGPPTPPDGTTGSLAFDFALTFHHAKLATAIDQDTCTVCHNQGLHKTVSTNGASVLLYDQNDVNSLATVTYDGTTANNGERFCVSCHDAGAAIRLGPNASQPFYESNDFTTPPNIGWTVGRMAHGDQMACFNCHGNSAGTGTFPLAPGAVDNTLNPKRNGHGSATAKYLQAPSYDATLPANSAGNFCYNCHGTTPAGGAVDNIRTPMSQTFGHGTPSAASVTCFSCHSVHQAQHGKHTAGFANITGVLRGATGKVSLTRSPATWPAMPASWTDTTLGLPSTIGSAIAEYQICLKCHTSLSGSGSTSLTDLSLEFNPNNSSGHPVVTTLNNYPSSLAPKALQAARMKAPWTNVGSQVMTCSDCHGSNGAGAQGPHGSSVKWLLTGTATNWPYLTTAGTGNNDGNGGNNATNISGPFVTLSDVAGGSQVFCLNCHNLNTNPHFSDGAHTDIPCVGCHVRVPHGGKVSRLINTQSSGRVPRYSPSGDGNGAIYIQQFVKTTPGNYQTSNCWIPGPNSVCHNNSANNGEAW